MRLHRPVAPHEQPHLQSFFQGGIPADGRFAPNAAANAGAGFDDGGTVPNDQNTGSVASNAADAGSMATVTPTTPGQWSDEDEARLQATNNTMENSILSRGLNYSLGKLPSMQARYDDGGVVDPNAYLQWPNQQPLPQTRFDDGGVVNGDDSSGEVNPTAMLDPSGVTDPATQQLVTHSRKVYDGIHAKMEAAFNTAQQGGSDNDADDQGYADGGGVPDPTSLDPQANQLDQSFNQQLQTEADAQLPPDQPIPNRTPQDLANQQANQQQPAPITGAPPPTLNINGFGLAGGGLVAPPGPAGPGVKPQAPTGNAGRPNWTAPNPKETASEKNYAQNVSSRPATSPARGTAFSQAAPDGGQRGQEWYGKGPSPYGAGRKKQNG